MNYTTTVNLNNIYGLNSYVRTVNEFFEEYSSRTETKSLELLYNALVINWNQKKIDPQKIQIDEQNKYREKTKCGWIYLY